MISPDRTPATLDALIAHRQVLLVVGAGGVGKTTLSAALGVAAAIRGRRVLVLTVDPAKRLANALGLKAFDEQVQHVTAADFAAQGCAAGNGLDAAMLDVKRTFDRVVSRYARSPESARRILEHPFYVQASTALAGSQEYMATERLHESVVSGDYDLVILDTPPAEHALDFIDAPRRLIDLFDSAAFRKLIAPSTRLRTGVFRSSSVVMRGLQRFTSVEMFSNLLEFFGALSETFDGFVARAREVQALLQGPQTAFVLVSACDAVSTQQARFLADHLQTLGMQPAAWIVNRVLDLSPELASAPADLETALQRALMAAGPEASGGDARDAWTTAKHMDQVARKLGTMAAADQAAVASVRASHGGKLRILTVGRSEREPDSLAELHRIAVGLLSSGSADDGTAP